MVVYGSLPNEYERLILSHSVHLQLQCVGHGSFDADHFFQLLFVGGIQFVFPNPECAAFLLFSVCGGIVPFRVE